MLKRYLEQRHIYLDSNEVSLALEREYHYPALEVLAYEVMAGTTGVISSICGYYLTSPQTYL